MKEHPILFTGPMVRQILAGHKTQTRRIVKFPPGYVPPRTGESQGTVMGTADWKAQPGDRLWVRETWAQTTVAGNELFVYREADSRTDYGGPWRPSIFMPRAAARLFLDVVSLGCQRLQDISHDDACAEGIPSQKGGAAACIDRYRVIWQIINGPGSWDLNPWVWVIKFRRSPTQ